MTMTNTRRASLVTDDEVERDFHDALTLLRSVRRTLSDLLERVRVEEEPGLLKEVGLKHGELETALRRAFEAEERYNAWAARTTGVQNACEIDFDALRQEIACRLQRLRDCGQEG